MHKRPVQCAVSLAFLKRFWQMAAAELKSDSVRTREVGELVKRLVASRPQRAVDVPELIPPSSVGHPTYFVSHKQVGRASFPLFKVRIHPDRFNGTDQLFLIGIGS